MCYHCGTIVVHHIVYFLLLPFDAASLWCDMYMNRCNLMLNASNSGTCKMYFAMFDSIQT